MHGSGSSDKMEINLVPLLDLVMQLLMFFMMCVNFVNEQLNESIKLPIAQSARPMDKTESDVLFLNVNSDGKLEVAGRGKDKALTFPSEVKYYLETQFRDAERNARDKDRSAQVKTAVIIRADSRVDYKLVYELMRLCKTVGYTKLQLRAITKSAQIAG